ncbi:MAG: DUF3467 domain-containing protein [Nitrospira sp.]|nr:DUF3467 domain-containing protein [Nitrospira sp.]
MATEDGGVKTGAGKTPSGPMVRFDDTDITNTYANVCNVSSSREEVVLVFGMNNAWERDASEVRVKLNSRVILSPFAAKRLALLLDNVIKQYEARFGVMDVGPIQVPAEKLSAK